MKINKRRYFVYRKAVTTLLLFLLLLSGCKKEEAPTKAQINKNLLTSGLWKVTSVTVDDIDQTDLFMGMTLFFGDNSFTSAGAVPVWSLTGTWQFTDETGSIFRRNDGIDVTIVELDKSKLQLRLDWTKTTLGSGRVSSIAGSHVFTFSK
jgi:hypothetical protein